MWQQSNTETEFFRIIPLFSAYSVLQYRNLYFKWNPAALESVSASDRTIYSVTVHRIPLRIFLYFRCLQLSWHVLETDPELVCLQPGKNYRIRYCLLSDPADPLCHSACLTRNDSRQCSAFQAGGRIHGSRKKNNMRKISQ